MVEALTEAVRRADLAIPRGASYEEAMALLAEAESLPGAEEWAPGFAGRRMSLALYYDRPVDELERALLAVFDVEQDQIRRIRSAGAAYATYPELRSYFDREVAVVNDIPPCAARTCVRQAAQRVRDAVRRKFGPGV